ncbi:MAG: alpha/beta hydrolase [Acidobacteriota bacterium]|nr:alpha/beta hydrolase [Acidobacteriota bacterium]
MAILSIAIVAAAQEPKTVLLWPNGAPGALGNADTDQPKLTSYLPASEKAVGTAVVICPGGGYGGLSMDKEGKQVALWMNSIGVAAFVLQYRLGPRYHHPIELMDAQRALRYVRAGAKNFGVSPDRIGIMGFSAGGHLAATAGTHFSNPSASGTDVLDSVSSRPDFLILAYPVISFTTSYTHRGSLKNLIGDNPDSELVKSLSNELQVTPQTPPTFLFHTDGDKGVPAENSVLFYLALRKAGIPAEMHIYQNGPHGVGLAPSDPVLSSWPGRLADWLRVRGLLTPK